MKVLGPDILVPKSKCLSCGKALDGATCVGEKATPKVGDITLCIYCGHLMAFGDDMMFRELNDEEMHEMAGDYRILMAQKARQKMKEEGKL